MSKPKRGPSSKQADPHLARERERYDKPVASREHITSLLRDEPGPMDFEALAEKLGLQDDPEQLEGLRRRVGAMQRDGQLIQNRRRGLVPVDADSLVAGRVSAHPDGFGFLIADDGDADIYLNGKQMRQVLHGDRVVVCITGTDHRGRREGRIVDVVERANLTLVGRVMIEQGVAVVSPDNKRIHQDLLIAPTEQAGAEHGDMVVAEIIEQPTRRQQPVGRIVEVLGAHLQPGMEIDVSLRSHDIPHVWPDEVIAQADGFSVTVGGDDTLGRKDIRRVPLVTIDGADARDFDDAVHCERTSTGWLLRVAIADVAHYVRPDEPLDIEARSRGTSVYFPGRVVPMLPEVLSNGLCSINPNVDRLCMLCEMRLDENGNLKRTRFYNALMKSHARLTYGQVNEMLTDDSSSLRSEFADVLPHLETLHALYSLLARARKTRGAIEFESNETRILFDENKKISEIVPVTRNDAHRLIEECMILANIAAAAFLERHRMPALYRVHHGPKTEKLTDLREFLALRGLTLGGGDSPSALDYANLAKSIEKRPDRLVVQTVMLRSMQQAVYQPKNDGHFGLALTQYAHFTSPIRRYPDLLVHRAIKHVLARASVTDYTYNNEQMQVLGEGCSMAERRADEATRDVVSWLKCEYMQDHIGSEFPGVVTAVTSFGLFVDLIGIHVEGLIHITNLSRDYYRFEAAAHALVGERSGRQYRLGDRLTVQVAAVNLEDRKIDFTEVAVSGKSQGSEGDDKGDRKRKKNAKKQQKRDQQRAKAKQSRVDAAPREATVDESTKKPTAVSKKSVSEPRHKKRKAKLSVVAAADAEQPTSKAGRKSSASSSKSKKSAGKLRSRARQGKDGQPESRRKKTSEHQRDGVQPMAASGSSGKKTGTRRKPSPNKAEPARKAAARVAAGASSKAAAGKKPTAKKISGKKPADNTVAGKKAVTRKKAAGKKTARVDGSASQPQPAGKKRAAKKTTRRKQAQADSSPSGTAAASKARQTTAASGSTKKRKKASARKPSANVQSKKTVSRRSSTQKKSASKKRTRKQGS